MTVNNTPATCVQCMGRGVVTQTEEGWGADEKGLPIWVKRTVTETCPGCEGRGTK